MARHVTAIVSNAGEPQEGRRVDFRADDPAQNVIATTDAAGAFRVELEPGMSYLVGSTNPFAVGGTEFPAGTTFVVEVPDGEGPVSLADVTVGILDLSPPALHKRIAALEAAAALPTPTPEPAPEPVEAPETNGGAA